MAPARLNSNMLIKTAPSSQLYHHYTKIWIQVLRRKQERFILKCMYCRCFEKHQDYKRQERKNVWIYNW